MFEKFNVMFGVALKYIRYVQAEKTMVSEKVSMVKRDSIDKNSLHYKEHILPLCVSASVLIKTESWHLFFVSQPVLHVHSITHKN